MAGRRLFKLRYEDISDISTNFKQNHINLITLLSVDGADIATEQKIREAFNQEYYATKVIYDEMFENNDHVPPPPIEKSNVNLPKIELLTFKGDLREFTAFRDMFDALVHNNRSLSNIEKFNYLGWVL